METLRIRFLSPRHPSDHSTGVAHVAAQVSAVWAKQGHAVSVCFPRGLDDRELPRTWEGVEAVPMEVRPRAHVPKSLEAETGRAFAREVERGADVAIANNEFGAFLPSHRKGGASLGVVALHGLALRFMQLERATRRGLRPRAGFYADLRAVKQLERQAIERADRVVAISRRVLEDAEATYGAQKGRARVIYNGTDPVRPAETGERLNARAALGLRDDERYAIVVGADAYRKGLDVAEAAVRRLRGEGRRVTLLEIGHAGPSEEGVVRLGRVSEERKRQVLLSGDVLLLPSRYEGFPGIAQEAAALGLPLVASRESGLDTGRPGEDFVEVPGSEPAAWAQALLSLLGDENRRRRLAERGSKLLSERTWQAMADDYLSMVREEKDGAHPTVPPR